MTERSRSPTSRPIRGRPRTTTVNAQCAGSREELSGAGTGCWCSRPRARRSGCATRARRCARARARAAQRTARGHRRRRAPRVRGGRGARCRRQRARRRRPRCRSTWRARSRNCSATVELDFVHVHEPFAPSTSSAALRHSRSLNVGSFHSSAERLLSTLRGAALGGELLRSAGRPHREPARHRRADGPPLPRRVPAAARRARAPSRSSRRIYRELALAATPSGGDRGAAPQLSQRPLIDVDLHMHTDHSGDCATPVEVLLATAREQGLGAIAVTDHNEISGALEAQRPGREIGARPSR